MLQYYIGLHVPLFLCIAFIMFYVTTLVENNEMAFLSSLCIRHLTTSDTLDIEDKYFKLILEYMLGALLYKTFSILQRRQ